MHSKSPCSNSVGLPYRSTRAGSGRSRALQARVDAAGKAATPTTATTVVAATPSAPAAPVTVVAVTRADYARFATETGRAAAECGKGVFGNWAAR